MRRRPDTKICALPESLVILVVDEFVNANPDVTVWLRAGWLDWVSHLPLVLAHEGPELAWAGVGRSDVLVTPPKPLDATAPDLPSTVAARAFRGWVPPGTAVEVEVIAQRTATDPNYGAGLVVSPIFDGDNPVPTVCQFAIIRDDASVFYNELCLLGYQSVVTGPSENERYPIDDNHYLAGVGQFDQRNASVPFSYALRLTNWQLPPNTPLLDIENWAFDNRPKGKSQTILLRDQSPLRDMLPAEENGPLKPFPTSPIQHVNIFIGDSVLIRERGLTDFRSAEFAYLQKLKDDERALQLGAWGMFRAVLMAFLKIGVGFGEIEPWNKMALNFVLDETVGGGKVPFPP
jgi:hypothetical protein